jgi:hypothetical protein
VKLCDVHYVWADERKKTGFFGGTIGGAWGCLASIAGNYENVNSTENADLACDLEGGWLPASLLPHVLSGQYLNQDLDLMRREVCAVYLDGNLIAYLIRSAT